MTRSSSEKNSILQHVALSVSSLERSIDFYCRNFDMKIVLKVDFADDRIGRVIGFPGAKCRMVQLEGNGGVLELFEYTNPKGQPIPPERTQADLGFSHVCFVVRDIDSFKRSICEQGYHLVGETVEVRPGTFVQYCHGPDGETMELKQIES
jgi:catechol 2,3-dioxygenase-like lactoylglutathione lyase family enzyme